MYFEELRTLWELNILSSISWNCFVWTFAKGSHASQKAGPGSVLTSPSGPANQVPGITFLEREGNVSWHRVCQWQLIELESGRLQGQSHACWSPAEGWLGRGNSTWEGADRGSRCDRRVLTEREGRNGHRAQAVPELGAGSTPGSQKDRCDQWGAFVSYLGTLEQEGGIWGVGSRWFWWLGLPQTILFLSALLLGF